MRCLTCMKIKKTQAIQNDARHPVYGWFKQFESLSSGWCFKVPAAKGSTRDYFEKKKKTE